MKLRHPQTRLLVLCLAAMPLLAESQINFINSGSRLPGTFSSGNAMGVADMDGDGLDDIVHMQQGNDLRVSMQRTGQPFSSVSGPDMNLSTDDGAWAITVGDANGDGYRDVSSGGYGYGLLSMASPGAAYLPPVTLPSSNFFFQNMNYMDVDNDGDADILGCDDNGETKIWVNDGTGTYTVSTIINFDVSPSDDSGNYGSVWTDFDNDGDVDLYIAKCRQGVNDPNDERRINVLFVNNGNGTYTENGQAHGLRITSQSWTANFEDVNNDGWFDVLVTNHDVPNMLLMNDGTGHFTQTANAGIGVEFMPLQSKMADFDNDGFVDVLITGGKVSPSSARLFRNNGSGTFLPVTAAFPGGNDIHSFAVGDLDHDGRLDLYASYGQGYNTPSLTGNTDVLWLNDTKNDNHFITFDLRGTVSNRDALGARVFIYGAWGVQTREVRAGESYGTANSFQLHFGLGSATVVDSAVIRWPAGGTTRLFNRPADQFITVIENQCSSPDNKITYTGSPIICQGQSLTLHAPAGTGYAYLWSNGATTQSIQATTTGEYNVKVTAGGCSSVSSTVKVQINPDQTPVIMASGDLRFCTGGQVTLQGPAGMAGYQWSGGQTTKDITVNQSGTYTLTVNGACSQFTSAPVNVVVVPAPVAPVVSDVNIPAPGTATLTATGNNLEWYAAATGGAPLATGNTYVTPQLTGDTAYYVQSASILPGTVGNVGQTDHTGSEYSSSDDLNAGMYFIVNTACVLKSVKVYTDKAGKRRLMVIDHLSVVVASALVDIPVTTGMPGGSTRIDLGFELPPGDYMLITAAGNNIDNLGQPGPRLRRTDAGATYPYMLPGGALTITETTEGPASYYYFYDWEVEVGRVKCPSQRVAANVTLGNVNNAGLDEEPAQGGFVAYPNPTSGILNVRVGETGFNGSIKVLDVTGKTVLAQTAPDMLPETVKTIDVSALTPGVYVLQLSDGHTVHTAKFIIR